MSSVISPFIMNDPQNISTTEPSEPIATGTPTGQEASFGLRIGAFLIDVAVMIGLSLVPRVGWLLSSAYLVLRDSLPFLDGQSIGKKALKTRAVTDSGKSLSGNFSEGLIRNIVLLIPFFSLVELIVLCTKNGKPDGLRRLGDQWAKTRVITQAD